MTEPIYIKIPLQGGKILSLNPNKIEAIIDRMDGATEVVCEIGGLVQTYKTLLTSEDIEDRVKEIMIENEKEFFGFLDDNSDKGEH